MFFLLDARFGQEDLRAGVGRNTTYFAATRAADRQISASLREVQELQADIAKSSLAKHRIGLWLGASQLHAINHANENSRLAVRVAQEILSSSESNHHLYQLSAGNANPAELLGMAATVMGRAESIDALIIAFVYDDLAEIGVRPELLDQLASAQQTEVWWKAVPELSQALSKSLLTAQEQESSDETGPLAGTPQQKLERLLVGELAETVPAYARRDTVRAGIEYWWTALLIEAATGGKRRSQVSVNEELRNQALHTFEVLLAECQRRGVTVYLYRQPLQQLDPPYHPEEEYDTYWNQVTELCARYDAFTRDFSSLVPNELWGLTNAGMPDAFHFQDEGHRLLGHAVATWLLEDVR